MASSARTLIKTAREEVGYAERASKHHGVRVRRGDTLSGIAKQNHVSLAALIPVDPRFPELAAIDPGRLVFHS